MWCILLSVFTLSLACVTSDLSLPRGDHRLPCPVSQHAGHGGGSISIPPLPTHTLHFHPEGRHSFPRRHLKADEKERRELSQVSVGTCVFELLARGWKRTEKKRTAASEMITDLSSAEAATCFINAPPVIGMSIPRMSRADKVKRRAARECCTVYHIKNHCHVVSLHF